MQIHELPSISSPADSATIPVDTGSATYKIDCSSLKETILAGLSTTTISKTSVSISANSYADISETLSRSGYTPLGVVGYAIYGSSACFAITCRVSSGTLEMRIKNTSSSAVTLTGVYVSILWALG